MQTVFLVTNPFDLSAYTQHEVEDFWAFVRQELPTWPPTARIYRGEVAKTADVTPWDDASADSLGLHGEPLYVVVYPAWAQVAAAALVYAVAWVVTQLTNETAPKPREQVFVSGSANNTLSERRNRARVHERVPDIFGTVRSVPDLVMYTYIQYEKHRAVEYSLACIGRGRHAVTDIRENDTPFDQIRDSSAVVYQPGQRPGGGTPSLIVGEMITDPAYAVYPVKSINGQDLPCLNAFMCHGSGLNIERLQSLNKWVDMEYIAESATTGIIRVPHNGDPDYVMSRIRAGDEIQVVFGVLPTGGGPIPDLSAGFYFGANPTTPLVFTPGVGIPPVRGDLPPLVVTDVQTLFNSLGESTKVEVYVNIPTSLQSEWAKIATYSGSVDPVTGFPVVLNKNSAIVAQSRWLLGYRDGQTDPAALGIFIDDPDCQEVWFNFVAPSNLILEDGANRKVLTQRLTWRLRPCDASGVPTADPDEFGFVELTGSLIGREQRAVTFKHVRTTPGRCLLIAARINERQRQAELEFDVNNPNPPDSVSRFFRNTQFNISYQNVEGPDGDPFVETAFTGNINDDIKLTECYSMSIPAESDPPQLLSAAVTLIHSRVVANQSATRIEERQLNCLATRQTGSWNGSIWQPSVVDTQGFVENMIFEAALDPKIGNRSPAEIDFPAIANAAAAVRAYFSDEDSTRFSYTFDDHNTSFEETIKTMTQACFLTPYRQANVLKCDPDIATDDSSVLFNHRNKKPGTEQRTVTFGMLNDNDGVEQQYTDVDTGVQIVTPISQFLSQPGVTSPLQSRVVGLRFRHQAWWHAYRLLMRIIHQHVATEFDAMNEAATVGINQRILVEDNTDPEVQDGEVTAVSGLVIRTSQPVEAAPSSTYTVHLQGEDGTVENIPCTPGVPDGHSITLSVAPTNPIRVNRNEELLTTYILVRDQDTVGKAMLVTDKAAKDQRMWAIQAVNYSHMYYMGDALILWIVPSTEFGGEEFFDRSPYQRPNEANIADLGSDSVWGPVWDNGDGFATNSNLFAATQHYTIMCWVSIDNPGTDGVILATLDDFDQYFLVLASGQLCAGHNGSNVAVAVIPGGVAPWHHYAVTFDVGTGILRLFVDGNVVATATGVAAPSLSILSAFNAAGFGPLPGKAKHLRHYCREMTPEMVREHYQKELLLP